MNLGFLDDLIDAGEDLYNTCKEEAEEIWDDAQEGVENLIETGEDLLEDAEDLIKETAEETRDWIVEKSEEAWDWIEEKSEEGWDWIVEKSEEMWDKITETAENIWDWITEKSEEAWDWLKETVEDAAEWMSEFVDDLIKFVVEDVIPGIIALTKIPILILKIFGALFFLGLCYLNKKLFGEEEASIIEGIAEHEYRLMEEFKISQLPLNQQYVIFSDLHIYVEGSFDFFNNNGNSQIYLSALNWYGSHDYHLIENGDIEDFWMRNSTSKQSILSISESLPYPFYSELYESSASLAANQVHAFNIFVNNAIVYSIVRTLFYDKGKYTRLIGNHDDVWMDPRMERIIQQIYPSITVYDYCTLEHQNKTSVILAHGHQSDIFNTPMCNFAGKVATEVASVLKEISLSSVNLFSVPKSEWNEKWNGQGFKNELTETELLEFVSFSEKDLYDDLKNIYHGRSDQPHLILSHTHNPKNKADIPNSKKNKIWEKYSNSGTAGMWEDIVFCLEVEYPDIRVIAWKKEDDGTVLRYELKSYRIEGENYLKP